MSAISWNIDPRAWLPGLVRKHFVRAALSAVTAVPVIVLGAWLLRYEVRQQDVNPMMAYIVNWPLITLVAFAINWFIWMDRGADAWPAFKRWGVASMAHTIVSYSLFTLMVAAFGLPYLFVGVGLTIGLGLGSYVVRHLWIFAQH